MVSWRLSQKVCVITGTGGGVGRAAALAFAREGASVVGCDVAVEPARLTVEIARSAAGEMVSMQPCRLDDPSDCQALVELALGTYGRIDVLCNCPAAAYVNSLDVVFYVTRAAWPQLEESGGVVVNME